MAKPTRSQIEATVTKPEFQIQVDTGSGYTTVTDGEVLSINGSLDATNSVDNGFAFGTTAQVSASVVITDSYTISNWQRAKLRILFGFDGSDKVTQFEGVITRRQRLGNMFQYDAEGFHYVISRKKIYTGVFYRRPVATKTTATSIEDWTQPGARPGIMNRICFTIGGRPLEQPAYATDPDFKFWYSFNDSIVKPRYAWVAGDDAWDELNKLVRAAGGQLFQDTNGVLRYQQPLTFGQVNSSLYEFTPALFSGISEDASVAENFDSIKASFVERVLQPYQTVYESTTPVLVASGESVRLPLEMQYPVFQYADNVTAARLKGVDEGIHATYLDGRDATNDPKFTVTVHERAAQLVDISINNLGTEPFVVSKITLKGRPITAGSEGVVTYGTPNGNELALEDNIYVQSYAQAYRLVRLYYDFYSVNRSIITLSGVGFDPDRYLGEVVELTYAPWSLNKARHRIVGINYSNGATMDVKLVPISGLITRDGVFIVGKTYETSDVRLVAY